jgi:hypothetical protein
MAPSSTYEPLDFIDSDGEIDVSAVAEAIVSQVAGPQALDPASLNQLVDTAIAILDTTVADFESSGLPLSLAIESIDAVLAPASELLPEDSFGSTERIDQPLPTIAERAFEAYIYGLAPVIVNQKNFDQTNSTAKEVVYAPINELYIDTATSTPESSLWVSPNVNVVYSSTHLDLSQQPVILETPDIQDRYFSWEIMDAYTNAFNYVGTRETGGVEGTYALVGPTYGGTIPDGITPILSPTNSVWMVGRHEVEPESKTDLEQVIGLIQESVLLPLAEYEFRIIDQNDPDYVNPIIEKPPIDTNPLSITGLDFYTQLNSWLLRNPPPSGDDAILSELVEIGVSPAPDDQINFNLLPRLQQTAVLVGERLAELDIRFKNYTVGSLKNGWLYNLGENFGNWGDDYLLRSLIARGGLGANINEEAVYPLRVIDRRFQLLDADRDYRITFEKEELPLLSNDQGFWSLTLYDRTDAQLAANAIDRYALGSQNLDNFDFAEDGSLTLYIQQDSPGDELENNWLPTPENGNPFYLLFRSYFPEEEFYTPPDDPSYVLPQLRRVNRTGEETGLGGQSAFKIYGGDDITVFDFGGIGTGSQPSQATIAEVDILTFLGDALTAENLQLNQNGSNLEISFLGDEDNTLVTLNNFELQNLDNLPPSSGLGNIIFDNQVAVIDSLDVFNADSTQRQIWNRDTVTFLNDLDNRVRGFNRSDDVINGQGGDDILRGLSGDDILRGGNGDDILIGGRGDDTLRGGLGDDRLIGDQGGDIFVLAAGEGTDTIQDFQVGQDLIGLANGLTPGQLTFSGSEILDDDEVLASLTGVDTTGLSDSSFLIV